MAALITIGLAAQAQNDKVVFALPRSNGGPRAYRLEIDEFLTDNAMTNLFLRALSEVQKNSIKHPGSDIPNWWSFYSIVGIVALYS